MDTLSAEGFQKADLQSVYTRTTGDLGEPTESWLRAWWSVTMSSQETCMPLQICNKVSILASELSFRI